MPLHARSPQNTAARLFALGDGGPVRVATALDAGITRGALRAAVAAGLLVSVRHGVVAVASPRDLQRSLTERCQDLAARRPSLIFCHQTAAALLEQPLLRDDAPLIRAYGTHSARGADVLVRKAQIPEDHMVEVDGLRVTSPLRTALDLARELTLPEALIPLDAALRTVLLQARSGCGLPDHLAVESRSHQLDVHLEAERVLQSLRHLHGARQARKALAVSSPLAESPAESASRGHLLLAGLPPVGLQVRVLDGDGCERRLDFLLAPGLAGEVDGFVKYEGDPGGHAARKEKRRDLALQRGGTFTVRWSAEESFWKPQTVIRVVRHALIAHGGTATSHRGIA
ncbi:MAG: hypothetical protein ACR2KE_03735 [Candidatus Nanopelagicales bacterium]